MNNEEWECTATNAALKMIPALHGMPLNQARRALHIAQLLLFQAHKVDASKPEFKLSDQECEHVFGLQQFT